MNSFFFFSSELIVKRILIVSIVVNKVFFQIKKLIKMIILIEHFWHILRILWYSKNTFIIYIGFYDINRTRLTYTYINFCVH